MTNSQLVKLIRCARDRYIDDGEPNLEYEYDLNPAVFASAHTIQEFLKNEPIQIEVAISVPWSRDGVQVRVDV